MSYSLSKNEFAIARRSQRLSRTDEHKSLSWSLIQWGNRIHDAIRGWRLGELRLGL